MSTEVCIEQRAKRGRGRPAKSSAEHIAQGSLPHRVREALAREGKLPPPVEPRPSKTVKLPKITRKSIDKVIRMLPGYDPWAHWGEETFVFDYEEAKRRIEFFHTRLHHSKGKMARTPFILEPWLQGVIANLFGWKRPDGTRRYREMLLYVPRKNAKTFVAAGTIMCCMDMDMEPGAEIYGIASQYRQACYVWDHAYGMVMQDAALRDAYQIFKGQQKAIQNKADPLTIYRVVATDSGALHGGNTHVAVIDELHALPDHEAIEVIETSFGAREQPLCIYITTADYERENSPCNAKHDYAKQVIEGKSVIDPAFLPVIYEAGPDEDWTDWKVIKRVNPMFGLSVGEQYLRRKLEKAKQSLLLENDFRRLHLNQRTTQKHRAFKMEHWDDCPAELDVAALAGCECWAGLDLSESRDICALVLGFPMEDGEFGVLPFFWLPRASLQEAHARKMATQIMLWQQQGFIALTEGPIIDTEIVYQKIIELAGVYRMREVVADRWGATQLTHRMAREGLTVVLFGQGYASMTEPTKKFDDLIVSHKLNHGGNPILRWMADNTAFETDPAGNKKPTKAPQGAQIDGITASIMAFGRALAGEREPELFANGIDRA